MKVVCGKPLKLSVSLYDCVQNVITIQVSSDLDLRHPTSIKFVIVNMSAKFDEDAQNGSVSFMFTRLYLYKSVLTLTYKLNYVRHSEHVCKV